MSQSDLSQLGQEIYIIRRTIAEFGRINQSATEKNKGSKMKKVIDIPKTLTGIGLAAVGALLVSVPMLNVLSKPIIEIGIGLIILGVGAKIERFKLTGTALNNTEKSIISLLKK